MELIQIIYPVLILTFGLFVLVTIYSFFLFKTKKENSRPVYEFETLNNVGVIEEEFYIRAIEKKKDKYYESVIMQNNNSHKKEVDAISESSNKNYYDLKINNIKRNNQRYTIMNHELKKNRTAKYY
jgi:lipopolysaccharide export LptBFGC system permease protein LptF